MEGIGVTIGPSLRRLVSLSSGALSVSKISGIPSGRVGRELTEVLEERNGFYAFESALLIRGSGDTESSLSAWNSEGAWRSHYGDIARGLYFFGEDLFGTQFAIDGDAIVSFDPESGERQVLGSSLEDWADRLFQDWNLFTGFSIAHDWQLRYGALPPGKRLVPRVPFMLGGPFTLDNLYPVDDALAMCARGEFAIQVRDLPDGTHVQLNFPEYG
jgi:hypothetical protein